MKLSAWTPLVLLAAVASAQDPEIPTHRQTVGKAEGVEIQTRDLLELAERIHVRRRASRDDTTAEPEEVPVASIARGLADGVRAFISPPLREGQDVQLLAGRYLVTVAEPAQHHWVDRFLRSQVGTAVDLVELEVHLFQAGATALEKAAIGKEPRALSRKDGIALARALEKDRLARGTKPTWLQVSSYPLAKSSLARLHQTSYVRDFETVGKAGGVLVGDPQIDVTQDGLTVDSTAFHLEGGRVGLLGKIWFADTLRPFPTKEFKLLANAAPVTIQVPARREFSIPIDLALEDGGYAALPGPIFEGRRLVAMLRARTPR